MSSRDWSEFNSDGESSVHGNPAPEIGILKKLTPQQEAVEVARGKVVVAETKTLHAVDILTAWRTATVAITIAAVPAWWEKAVEAESYLDMSFQGQYTKERLEEEILEAGAPSLKLFLQEEARQSKIKIEVSKLECPETILSLIGNCAKSLNEAKNELLNAEAALDSQQPQLPPKEYNGWVVCSTREDAESLSKVLNFYRYDGQSKNARDKMVLTCSQAERLTHPKSKEKYIPENVFVFNEPAIVDIGFGVDLINIKKRVSENKS